MTTSIDTNVWIAFWDLSHEVSFPSKAALLQARDAGDVLVCGTVFAELLAAPGRSMTELDRLFAQTDTTVDWDLGEQVIRLAGTAFQGYVARRRRSHGSLPKRVLSDFFIGAHAEVHGYRLMTMDKRLYRAAFPKLHLIEI